MENPKKCERIVVTPRTTEIMLEWKDENGKTKTEWIEPKQLIVRFVYEQKK